MDDIVLRPPLSYRILFPLLALFFAVPYVPWLLRQVVAGSWSVLQLALAVVLGLVVVALVYMAALVLRQAVWVEDSALHVRGVAATKDYPLVPPTTVRFSQRYVPGFVGDETWVATVEAPGVPETVLDPRTFGRFPDLARLLQADLREHPDVAADDTTRRVVEDPEIVARQLEQLQQRRKGR